MRKINVLLFLLCILQISLAAQQPEKGQYWVSFTDKAGSPFSIEQPEQFLSKRALERRKKQHILVNKSDLPVSPTYLQELQNAGATILHTSRWLNGATILIEKYSLQVLENQSFISEVQYVGKPQARKLLLRRGAKERDAVEPDELLPEEYGYVLEQTKMINAQTLHEAGFRGKGMLIAVLDGGFSNVDIMPFFDKMRSENRLLATYDFVDKDEHVFESSAHGSQVLSVMAANMPGLMVGTAPDASYLCFKTEDSRGEYLVEESYWIAALEYADSMGVDVVNSSLGYSVFHDAKMNYEYADLDGKTARMSLAADIAFQKGIIIVNAAGNAGNSDWKYIDVPADAKNILTVGAVDHLGLRADFSSFGPTADGRIKPEVVALGKRIGVASIYSPKVNATNGTSFAAPLVAGAVASLWQAFPDKTNAEIIEAIQQSASQAFSPDNELGYGIPDFGRAWELLGKL